MKDKRNDSRPHVIDIRSYQNGANKAHVGGQIHDQHESGAEGAALKPSRKQTPNRIYQKDW